VKPTERSTRSASTPKTGGFAMLPALLASRGTGAPSFSRRTRPASLALLAGLLALSSLGLTASPAFAAAPEAPTTEPAVAVTSTTATVEGVLDPAASAFPVEPGTYEFLYKESETTCTGGSHAPASPGMYFGIAPERVSEALTGLKPATTYTVCLRAETAGGNTVGSQVMFTTVPTPDTEAATAVGATTATFHGTLTPLNPTVASEYQFDYDLGSEPICTDESATTLQSAGTGSGSKAVSTAATGLQPDQQYTVCLVAKNSSGSQEDLKSPPIHFATNPAPPAIEGESTSRVPASEANPHPRPAVEVRLEGIVNPDNEVAECHFQYGTEPSLSTGATSTLCEPGSLVGDYGGKPVALNLGGLQSNQTYYYRVLAKNAAGTELGTIEHFTTAIEPETPSELKAEPIGSTTATLNGVLNPTKPGEAGTYEFSYRESSGECQGGATTPQTASTTSSPQPVSAEVTGLQPGAEYTFCLIAHNSVGETTSSSPVTFTTLAAAPTVSGEQVTNVDETTVDLQAEVDPDGAQASYYFQYGTTTAYSEPATALTKLEGSLTSSGTAEAHLSSLQPGTTYHYRAVAQSEVGGKLETSYGPDETFTTEAPEATNSVDCENAQRRAEQPFAERLPDCRAYEMVSPVDTEGQDATDSFVQTSPRAAESGEAVTYAARGSWGEPEGITISNQFLSRRGPEGWTTQPITPLREPSEPNTFRPYDGGVFTPELTAGIVSTEAPLTGETPIHQKLDQFGLYRANFASKTYDYLVDSYGIGVEAAGGSSNLEHVVFGEKGTLYDSTGPLSTPVSVGNHEGETFTSYVGSAPRIYEPGFGFSGYEHSVWHAVSASGTRVFFTGGALQLYVRDNPEAPQSPMSGSSCTNAEDACTVEVSASQKTNGTDPHGPGPALFQGADASGSKVYFTSYVELTNDAYTGPSDNEPNLYLYEPSAEPAVPGRLTDLSVDDSGDGADVLGVSQISENGSYVYFVATGALAGGATAGRPNLYVSHEAGPPTFIATLNTNDFPVWHLGREIGEGGPAINHAVVSPDGSWFAFASEVSLTGYDNAQAAPGDCESGFRGAEGHELGHCEEIYLYEAAGDRLVCASCNPTGTRPEGGAKFSDFDYKSFATYRSRNLLENGTLFFDSPDALTPHATSGKTNVYEYEDGTIYPISDVSGGYESFFLDASADGRDVFFGSADQLLPQDTGNNVEVWDARVDGGFPIPAPPQQQCDDADQCKAAPTAQPEGFGVPPSATFSGPGNLAPAPALAPASSPAVTLTAAQVRAKQLATALKACKRDKRTHKRLLCERAARTRYRAKASNRVRTNKGAHR
jgi:hypothetical protein